MSSGKSAKSKKEGKYGFIASRFFSRNRRFRIATSIMPPISGVSAGLRKTKPAHYGWRPDHPNMTCSGNDLPPHPSIPFYSQPMDRNSYHRLMGI
jgi:hypothetical protein